MKMLQKPLALCLYGQDYIGRKNISTWDVMQLKSNHSSVLVLEGNES